MSEQMMSVGTSVFRRGVSQESDGLVEIETADCTDGTDELVAALSEIQPAVVDRRYSTCSGFDSVLSAQSAVSRFFRKDGPQAVALIATFATTA
jgi:hypothetical protein